MPEIQILFQGENDAPRLAFLPGPAVDFSHVGKMIFTVCEKGMVSDNPSVLIVSPTEVGNIVIQTSLDKFIAAGVAMQEGAKSRWGWEQEPGYATFLPPSRETRKAMLLQIQAELLEFEEADNAAEAEMPTKEEKEE